VDFKLEKFQVAAKKFNKLELWEWMEPVKITVELNIHHHVLCLGRALQQADGAPAALDAAQQELVQLQELLHVNMIPTT
jgi:hypothetical protein